LEQLRHDLLDLSSGHHLVLEDYLTEQAMTVAIQFFTNLARQSLNQLRFGDETEFDGDLPEAGAVLFPGIVAGARGPGLSCSTLLNRWFRIS
jgi:hypothetical protein